MTLYESIIKVGVHDPKLVRANDICAGLAYAAVILIDEYGWSLDAVADALDNARQDAEDEWYNLHPSEPEADA